MSAKGYPMGTNEVAMSYKAKTQQSAGRSANAATAQAKALEKQIRNAQTKLDKLQQSAMSSIGKESKDTIRGRRVSTPREDAIANESYKGASTKGKTSYTRRKINQLKSKSN